MVRKRMPANSFGSELRSDRGGVDVAVRFECQQRNFSTAFPDLTQVRQDLRLYQGLTDSEITNVEGLTHCRSSHSCRCGFASTGIQGNNVFQLDASGCFSNYA